MGKRGPPPKPSALKILEGTYRPDRAPKNEPKPPVKKLRCPSFLKPAAAQEWRRVHKVLADQGITTALDLTVLGIYCQNFAYWLEYDEMIRDRGHFIDNGPQVITAPWVVQAKHHQELCLKAAKELGFTPSSRSRVEALPTKKKDESDPFK